MTDEQKLALQHLKASLKEATETGLFDELAADIHPDIINRFCDAIGEGENV